MSKITELPSVSDGQEMVVTSPTSERGVGRQSLPECAPLEMPDFTGPISIDVGLNTLPFIVLRFGGQTIDLRLKNTGTRYGLVIGVAVESENYHRYNLAIDGNGCLLVGDDGELASPGYLHGGGDESGILTMGKIRSFSGFQSQDGSDGVSATIATPSSLTIKNGLITAYTEA